MLKSYTGVLLGVDDLADDWEMIKGLPFGKTLTDDVDIRDEMVVGAFPDVIYRIVDVGYSFRFMAVWRYKCFGQRRRGRPGYHRATDCWIAQHDELLWKGEKYVPPWTPQDMERRFLVPKNQAYTTIADLKAAFAQARDKHIANCRDQVRRWAEDITKLRDGVAGEEDLIARMTGFMPELGR